MIGWRITISGVAVAAVAAMTAEPRPTLASCNTIPSTERTFRSALGSADRPFAGPDEFLELRVRPSVCDQESAGFDPLPSDHVVTVVFKPPVGPVDRNNVVLL